MFKWLFKKRKWRIEYWDPRFGKPCDKCAFTGTIESTGNIPSLIMVMFKLIRNK